MTKIQYTIRQVPERVDRIIRRRAEQSNRSLNAVVLEILERGVGVADEPQEYHDLDELAGSWVNDPDFDVAMETFESIDAALWK